MVNNISLAHRSRVGRGGSPFDHSSRSRFAARLNSGVGPQGHSFRIRQAHFEIADFIRIKRLAKPDFYCLERVVMGCSMHRQNRAVWVFCCSTAPPACWNWWGFPTPELWHLHGATALAACSNCLHNHSSGRCGPTIHSSRRRFAARLNSGVRPL